MNKFVFCLILSLALVACREVYDTKTSYVTPITSLNFKSQISKIRETTSQVSIVQYYKYNDGFSQQFQKEFDEWTDDNRGLFRIGACDCDEEKSICEKEGITTFPTFRIYPPTPMPQIDMTGPDVTAKKIQQKAAKQLNSNVIEITNTNIQAFITDSPAVPKVFLFTNQPKGTPMIYKGLSVAFENKLFFGLIRSSDDILVDRYRIKSFPTIIIVKTNEKKHKTYSGEMKFNPIFDFLNVDSQAFVPGGGSSADSQASKSWLTEIVPELHGKSANDICLKTEGTLCVIHVGKGKPEKDVIEAMKSLNTAYDRKIERGSQFKFMWMDAEIEKEHAHALGYQDGTDRVVVLNPGKRKRYVLHKSEFTFDALKKTLESINGGDARFQRTKLPSQWALRKD